MKKARFAVAFAILVLFALPSSATICGFCDWEIFKCVPRTGYDTACDWQSCAEHFVMGCARAPKDGPELFAADYAVASVEITTPAKHDVRIEQQPRAASLAVAALEVTK